MARVPDNIRLRQHRELFQRAIRENVSMDEARRRIAAERWASTESRLASKKAAAFEDEDRQPGFWWQR